MSSSWLSLFLWSLLVVGPLIYVAIITIANFRKFRRRAKYVNMLPAGQPWNGWFSWFFGLELPGPKEEGLKLMRDRAIRVKEGLATIWFGPLNPSVSLFHSDSIKTILKTSEPKPRGIGGYFMLVPWLGDGLLLTRGPKWARNRRLLTPAFHFDILRPYMQVYNRSVDIFVSKLQGFAERGEFFETTTHASLLTLDVILRCAFSYDNDCQLRGKTHPYVTAVDSLGHAATYRLLHPYLYPDIVFNLSSRGREFKRNCQYVHQVSEEIIDKRKKTLLEEGEKIISQKGRYLDFLDILLTAKDDDGQGLTDQEIRDEVDTFLFAGHDTTASGISWAMYSLASHPEHQTRCQQEIDEILSGRDSQDIEWDDLPQLKYLTMCLKESLRLHTPVPLIERETTKDMTIEGYFIPSGTLIDVHLFILHHNPQVWDSPEEYRPDRFNDENKKDMVHFAFVPFSAGPRNCIGQHFALHEMKTAIAKILSRFTLSPDPEREVKHELTVVMKTENGMYMKATPRVCSSAH